MRESGTHGRTLMAAALALVVCLAVLMAVPSPSSAQSQKDRQEQPNMINAYEAVHEASQKIKYANQNYKYAFGGHLITASNILDAVRAQIAAAIQLYRDKYYRPEDTGWKQLRDPLPH